MSIAVIGPRLWWPLALNLIGLALKKAPYSEQAARWCEENDYNTDAIFYYDKAGEYESTIRVVYHLPPQIPFNEAKFILDIYDHAPAGAMDKFETYCAQRARQLISAGRYADAVEEMNGYIKNTRPCRRRLSTTASCAARTWRWAPSAT